MSMGLTYCCRASAPSAAATTRCPSLLSFTAFMPNGRIYNVPRGPPRDNGGADIVDTAVVLSAARRGDAIVTRDADDIERLVAFIRKDPAVPVIAAGDEENNAHVCSRCRAGQTVEEGVGGVAIRAHEETPLRAAAGNHVAGSGQDGPRE
jgi:hypothetical protein